MAVTDEWDKVDRAFDHLDRYRVLHPTLVAMRKLARMLAQDTAFADVRPTVSLASLMLSRGRSTQRVCVAWHDDDGRYWVYLVDPPFELSKATTVGEDAVVQVLCEHLDKLDGT